MERSMTLRYFTESDGLAGKNPVRTETAYRLQDIRRVLRDISKSYGIMGRNQMVRRFCKESLEIDGINWEPR